MSASNESRYSELLRDPRWQKLRLEKMQACDWKCEVCGDGSEELNVHHLSYRKTSCGEMREPWRYEIQELQCLCKTCHTITHLPDEKLRKHMKRLAVEIVPMHTHDVVLRCAKRVNYEWLEDEGVRLKYLKLCQEVRKQVKQLMNSTQSTFNEICAEAVSKKRALQTKPNANQ